jgi:DNA polymerase-3 subunit delta'
LNLPWLQDQRREFAERLGQQRLAHAVLLDGPAGTGKLGLAKDIISSLLCREGAIPSCGRCRSCQLIASGAHPDHRELTFEEHPKKAGVIRTEIVIDQVRDLISSLQLTTSFSERKTALIHPAEAMNKNAANALLKTLEEPPGDTVLLLLSHDPRRLPVTIRSRCQALHVRMPGESQASRWLMAEESIDRSQALDLLRAAAGSPLRAQAMLHQGGVDEFRLINATLEELLHGTGDQNQALKKLSELDPAQMWNWLSLSCANKLRGVFAVPVEAAANDSVAARLRSLDQPARRRLSVLQRRADRNHALLGTPVRKDLLLQDWLIQWTRLARDDRT